MIVFASILLLFAAFALFIGGLAWAKRLPGNSYVGLRVPEVRKSREIWDLAHGAAGPVWELAGVVLLFGGLLTLRMTGPWGYALGGVSLLLALVLAGIGGNLGARVAAAAAASLPEGSDGCGDTCGCGDQGCASTSGPEVDVEALRAAMKAPRSEG